MDMEPDKAKVELQATGTRGSNNTKDGERLSLMLTLGSAYLHAARFGRRQAMLEVCD